MQQHINLHTLGYSILANFSEGSKNACELMQQQNLHTKTFKLIIKLIDFMRILSGAANSVIIHKTICLIPETY